MFDPVRRRAAAHAGSVRLPRWLVDDRFDAAMAGTTDGDWQDSLPDTGLPALAIPLLSISAWVLILWGVTRIW
jgi:hypothetical protein